MGERKRPERYHDAVREILLREWDPIGVRDRADARDESNSYVHRMCLMIARGEPAHRIAERLWSIETSGMGLRGDRLRAERVADRLAGLCERSRTGE